MHTEQSTEKSNIRDFYTAATPQSPDPKTPSGMKEAPRGEPVSQSSVSKRAKATTVVLVVAVVVTVGWVAMGSFYHYSNAWRFSMTTFTTIATLLVLFLIQHRRSQNAAALHAKLEELARATEADRNAFDRLRGRRSRISKPSSSPP
jgi:hypothetical protein